MSLLLSPLLIKNILLKKKKVNDTIINSCWFCQQECDDFVSICKYCKDKKIKKKIKN
jgi:hypothetical protein